MPDALVGYDPSKVDFNKRASIEEIRRFLALKGLQCVWIKPPTVQGGNSKEAFTIGCYYKLRVGDGDVGIDYLPAFDAILDDPDAPIEFVTLELPQDYYPSSDPNIERKVVDKKRLKEPEGKSNPVTNYDALLQDYMELPYIEERTQAHVILRRPLKRKDGTIAEYRAPPDPEFAEPDGLGYGKIILASEVESAYEIDLAVLKKFNFILRSGRLYYDLTEFLRWRMNLD